MFQGKYRKTRLSQYRAKELRQRMNHVERLLWKKLRANRFHGFKFRRQVPIGIFIVDFLCAEKNLIIEVDGNSHFLPGAKEYDRNRERYLRKRGFQILRFRNHMVRESMEHVLQAIRKKLEKTPSP